MAKRITTIAEAVKDWLNEQSFSLSFTAVRAWDTQTKLKENASLVVQVSPMPFDSMRGNASAMRGPETRRAIGREYVMEIAILKQVDPEDNTEVDPLSDLCEEITDAAIEVNFGGGVCYATNGPFWDATENREKRQFAAVVRLSIKAIGA
jgi:hypothetical protein